MTPPDLNLGATEAIILMMWVIRDLPAILTVRTAGSTLLVPW
jgi:hypothetical protein